MRSEGVIALYKGLAPTLVGIAPYAALNFATYDLLKKAVYHGERWGRGGGDKVPDGLETLLHVSRWLSNMSVYCTVFVVAVTLVHCNCGTVVAVLYGVHHTIDWSP